MGYNFARVDRDQLMLMPLSMADRLPEDHLVWFVLDVVDELDLSAFLASYRPDGRGGVAYHPAANRQPDHATIARFRAPHTDALAGLFAQVLALCARGGVSRPALLAIDGTKLAANASRDANRTAAQLAEEILAEAAAIDAAEDADGAAADPSTTLPQEWNLRQAGERRRVRRVLADAGYWSTDNADTARRRSDHRARHGPQAQPDR